MKIEIVKSEPVKPEEQLWFRSKHRETVFRRGKNGLCISEKGVVSANYIGDVYKVFDNSTHYEPLLPGDKIVITL